MMSDGFLYDIVQSKSLNASESIPHHAAVICLIDVIFFSTTLHVGATQLAQRRYYNDSAYTNRKTFQSSSSEKNVWG